MKHFIITVFFINPIFFSCVEVNMNIRLLNALSNKVIEKEIVLAHGSRSGLRSGNTNTDGNVMLGPFVTGEEISVQVSQQGIFCKKAWL